MFFKEYNTNWEFIIICKKQSSILLIVYLEHFVDTGFTLYNICWGGLSAIWCYCSSSPDTTPALAKHEANTRDGSEISSHTRAIVCARWIGDKYG